MIDGLPDLQTGSTLKNQIAEFDLGENAMRVTTTEARDIFDDNEEIWNYSICLEQAIVGERSMNDPSMQAPDVTPSFEEKSVSQVRANHEEEYFRLICLALKIEHS